MYLIGEKQSKIFIVKEYKDDYTIPKLGYKEEYGQKLSINKLPKDTDTVFYFAIRLAYSNRQLIQQPIKLDIFKINPKVVYQELEVVNAIMRKRIFDFLSNLTD